MVLVDNSSLVMWCGSVCFGFFQERDLKHDAVEKLFNNLLYGPVADEGHVSFNIRRQIVSQRKSLKRTTEHHEIHQVASRSYQGL